MYFLIMQLIEMYQDQPLFNEVDSFMRERGFHLFDLKLFYWRRKSGLGFDGNRRGQLVHGDALYFRNTEKYFNVLENSGFYIRERLLKSVAIALFFGYTDYAISILDKAMNRKDISFNEYSQLSKVIKRKKEISSEIERITKILIVIRRVEEEINNCC